MGEKLVYRGAATANPSASGSKCPVYTRRRRSEVASRWGADQWFFVERGDRHAAMNPAHRRTAIRAGCTAAL